MDAIAGRNVRCIERIRAEFKPVDDQNRAAAGAPHGVHRHQLFHAWQVVIPTGARTAAGDSTGPWQRSDRPALRLFPVLSAALRL